MLMTREPGPHSKTSAALARENRLKAALKANMARRKAQARARGAEDTGDDRNETPDGSGSASQDRQ